MNAIMQKRIEEAAEEYANSTTSNLLNVFETTGRFEGFEQGATFALQNQWISIKEALPEERDKEDEQYSTNVFTRTKDCIRYAYYDFYNESWCSVEGGYRFGGDVTHWMYIPSLEGGEK